MPRIHLIEGPVGAGKSTFAAGLGKRQDAPCFNLDDWMATLFRPDRPATGAIEWYVERKDRCIVQIWKLTCALMEAGGDVILELGLVQRSSREHLFALVDAAGYDVTVYVLDAPRDVRRERVRQRNRDKGATFAMEVPDAFFEIASDMWEPIEPAECDGRDVRFVSTDD